VMAKRYVTSFGVVAERLASCFWPGPLTLILPRSGLVPDAVTGGGATVALRAPSHPIARALIAAVDAAVAAPSANRYQSLSPTLASHVVASFRDHGDKVDLLLDGGPTREGIESTVIDLTGARPRVLRLGAIATSELRVFAPELESLVELTAPTLRAGFVRPAPGLDARHYAPRSPLTLLPDAMAVVREAARLDRHGTTCFALFREPLKCEIPGFLTNRHRTLPRDPVLYARRLFAVLHEVDELGAGCILVERVPGSEPWEAISDRLQRAAHINKT
jgi:L-threonylcarbamoyladenylate synthase